MFGELMNASHVSLSKDYEVTGIELDTMVEAAWKQDGVIGARMTGAGFGGCTVSIVEDACVDSFIRNVGKEYQKKSDMLPIFILWTLEMDRQRISDQSNHFLRYSFGEMPLIFRKVSAK